MVDIFFLIIKMTAIQIFGIFGIFFVLGFILSKLQEKTHKIYQQTIGWKGILWTAWIGTPFHEFGHYVFAKLFRHKIHSFRVFAPNKTTGDLGHLDHSCKKYSPYQKIGNFFIGAAPMIFGSTALFLLVYFILPNGKEIFLPLTQIENSFGSVFLAFQKTLFNLFSPANLSLWYFWLWLYFSFCIASHLAPSKADRQGMWSGLRYIIAILILINIFGVLFKLDITDYITHAAKYLKIFTAIFSYAIIISFVHFIFSYVVLSIIKKLKS